MLLAEFLTATVPIRIMELKRRGGPTEEDFQRAREFSQVLGESGDALLFPVPGKTAALANRLAETVAVLAFVPGGITLFDQHYEAKVPGAGGRS